MKYYIISGEASGDLHGSALIKELKALDKDASFKAWGGDLMRAEGVELVKHYRDLSFMGFTEVLFNIRTIFKNLNFCKKDILDFNPDVLILIDYPGFNMRIAEFAKKNKIKVFYYITPQIWAWKESRVHQLKKNVDKLFVILPFEKAFFKKYNLDVDFVGHPLLDYVSHIKPEEDFLKRNKLSSLPIIALLPGSRKQEINNMLPLMDSMVKSFPNHQFVIAAAPSIPLAFYKKFVKTKVKVVSNSTYQLLLHSTAALVTSGTATLETALFEVPMVVCYKGSRISYHIAKWLIKVKYISLVNLIMDKGVVKELIQDHYSSKNLQDELNKILNPVYATGMKEQFKNLKSKLGGPGASKRTAELMVSYLKRTK